MLRESRAEGFAYQGDQTERRCFREQKRTREESYSTTRFFSPAAAVSPEGVPIERRLMPRERVALLSRMDGSPRRRRLPGLVLATALASFGCDSAAELDGAPAPREAFASGKRLRARVLDGGDVLGNAMDATCSQAIFGGPCGVPPVVATYDRTFAGASTAVPYTGSVFESGGAGCQERPALDLDWFSLGPSLDAAHYPAVHPTID